MAKQRNPYFDTMKYVLIALVVFGHTLASRKHAGINHELYLTMLLFKMPLFIFISGYFSRVKDHESFFHGLTKILETFLVFQVIGLFIAVMKGEPLTLRLILTPQWPYWYLLCLVYWRLMLYFIDIRKNNWNPLLVMAASVVLAIGAGFIPIHEVFEFQRTFTFLPFFVAGVYASKYQYTFTDTPSVATRLAAALFLFAVFALAFVIEIPQDQLLLGKWNYTNFDLPVTTACMYRVIHLVMATAMGICVMTLIPHGQTKASILGQETLFVYVYHAFFIHGLRSAIRHMHFPNGTVSMIIYASIILLVLHYLYRVKFLQFMLNPITNLRKTDKNK